MIPNSIKFKLWFIILLFSSAASLEEHLITASDSKVEQPNGTVFLSYDDDDVIHIAKPMKMINGNESQIAVDLNATETKSRVEELSKVFKSTIYQIRQKHKKIDIVFLIDSSSSVGKQNFLSEMKFVVKFLSDFNVSFNYTRVAIVTFSSQGKIIRHVDHISEADEQNEKCKLLNHEIPNINFTGGGTFTAGALKEAKLILSKARRHSKKMICLITDGFSNGQSPVPIAEKLKSDNITIITFGIQSGNYVELFNISSSPGTEHSFLLDSFAQFESLARKALHSDYKLGNTVRIKNSESCDILCDKTLGNETASCCDQNAECTCSTVSGHYSCICKPGYYGTGLVDKCELCPNGTYWQTWNFCRTCPDRNHVTLVAPAINSSYCVCKTGFVANNDNRCEILTCPQLKPPEHGYFVKTPTGCGQVLNAACGARCKSGYQLIGSSIRLCQSNGTWSGIEPKCGLKTCPRLSVPYYGMVTCKNSDLNVFYDYTPRNETFMEFYDNDEMRITEPMPIDTDCTFKCGPGFYMVGSTSRNCLPLSKWDGLQTTCKQILCASLNEVAFGQYQPSDCTEQKIMHGTNCTLTCAEGFEMKGPAVKTCGGKKTGIWSNRNKHPKCVDVTPPVLLCPGNFSVPMSETDNFAVVKIFPPPNVTDNSDQNITFWLKPSVKDDGVKLTLGNHTFTYVAVDSFKNKAKCNFTVTVMDITSPVLDNCINPSEFIIPTSPTALKNLTFIDWEPPTIYDNSNAELNITQNIKPGHLGIGMHTINYTAVDSSGNQNTCLINVTVNALKCDLLASPANGQSLCAKNSTHTWCGVTCDFGFAIYDETADSHLDTLQLYCENDTPKWKYETIPDCTKMELPDTIEQVINITLDLNETTSCNDSVATEKLHNEIVDQVREQLCGNLTDCEIASEIPDCVDIVNNRSSSIDSDLSNKTFYKVVKRDTLAQLQQSINNGTKLTTAQANMKLRVYTRISKRLGLWDYNLPRSENIQRVKAELHTYHFNENLRKRLEEMRINVKHLDLDEMTVCRNGSVAKQNICVQCPRGSFHNQTAQICQLCPFGTYSSSPSQTECQQCSAHYSTRKLGSKSDRDCVEQCPPGTLARMRIRSNRNIHNSLMPFCSKCPPAQYQPHFNQIKCLDCSINFTSPRGSQSSSQCYPIQRHACHSNPTVCGPHGICEQEQGNIYLYNCLCQEDFIGSHCEHQLNLCATYPCHNSGRCEQLSSTAFKCHCSEKFAGEFCETEIDNCKKDLCQNGGTCVESDGKFICECLPGYEGDACEIHQNFCSSNPCESGSCLNTQEGYLCQCPAGIIGRRCHLRPCDYFPCHRNAHCIDLKVFPASRNSYTCQCPKGLKGYDCSQVHSPCDEYPCRNHGQCIPMALRDPMSGIMLEDESLYEKYICKCAPYFYGDNCEVFTKPDFVLEFNKSGVHNYVEMRGPMVDLKEISFCTWIQTNDSFNYGTILSYATEKSDNMFTLTDYNGFVVYVNGKHIITDIILNDGQWHFICVCWTSTQGFYEIYVDGILRDTGYNLSSNASIEANGTLILGQEQDTLGASFSESESFVGRIAYLDVWDRFISAHEMYDYYTTCGPYQGNLYAWTDFKSKVIGNVKATSSPFCKPCAQNLHLINGYIRYMGNRAFHYCYDGYRLNGPNVRDCLRSSRWSLPVPFCRSIRCGYLPSLVNGAVTLEKTRTGEQVVYTCNENYYLVGDNIRSCQSNGTWSGAHPECISSIQCGNIIPPRNSIVIYANERGVLKEPHEKYPMGTFIEIQCLNGTVIKGESFLTCTESSAWDYSVPECIDFIQTTTETMITTQEDETTSYPTWDTTVTNENISSTSITPSSTDQVDTLTIRDFLRSFVKFLYQGCENRQNASELCEHVKDRNSFLDLTHLNATHLYDLKNMDTKLVMRLENATFQLRMSNVSQTLSFENILNFILYGSIGNGGNEKLSASDEASYRLVLYFYIDAILNDSRLNMMKASPDENINDKIKRLLHQLVTIVYENYKTADFIITDETTTSVTPKLSTELDNELQTETLAINRNSRSTLSDDSQIAAVNIATSHLNTETTTDLIISTSTEADKPVGCLLNDIPAPPTHSSIHMISTHNKTFHAISEDLMHAPVAARINYTCLPGYVTSGNKTYIECLENYTWNQLNLTCQAIICERPMKYNDISIKTSRFNDIYYFGDKLPLKCNEGFELHGEDYISCMETGKWSKIMSHCSKIECPAPLLSTHARIQTKQFVYLYLDKIIVKCPDKNEVEITCQSNRQWLPKEMC